MIRGAFHEEPLVYVEDPYLTARESTLVPAFSMSDLEIIGNAWRAAVSTGTLREIPR
jgi:hypothetical protein